MIIYKNSIALCAISLLFTQFLACSAADLENDRIPLEVRCPLEARAARSSFKNTGHVKITFSPPDVSSFLVLDPVEDSFTAVRETHDIMESQDSTGLSSRDKRLRAFRVSWGLPGSAWYPVGESLGGGEYLIKSGTYRVRIIYQMEAYRDFPQLCLAETEPFEILEPSTLISVE